MKLWILKPVENLAYDDDPWENPYDKCHGFVIRATTEKEAREIASKEGGDERRTWLNYDKSTCKIISIEGVS